MGWIGSSATTTMTTPEGRRFPLLLLLALLIIGLPWAAGGQSPLGNASLLLAVTLGAGMAFLAGGETPPRFRLPAIAAGSLVGLSAVHTIYPDRTIQTLLLLAAYLLAGALARHLARAEPAAESWLLMAIFLAGLVVAMVGALSRLQGGEGGLYATLLIGPFGYPNAAAGFLLLSLGAGLALAAGASPGGWRSGILGLLVIPAGGILLTRSRGALIALAAGGVVWAALARSRWWGNHRLWFSLAGLLGAGGVLVTSARWHPLLSAMRTVDAWELLDPSALWRWQILTWTWQMIRDHPWLGVGPGAFPVALLTYQRLPYVSGLNPHNVYLELAAELGLPAASLMVLGFFGLLMRLGAATRRLKLPSEVRLRLEVILATLVALAFHAAVDLLWSVPAIPAGAALLAGIAAGHLPGARRNLRASVARRLACALTLVCFASLAVSRYSASLFLDAGRAALASRDASAARAELARAYRFNPVSFAVHEALVRALLASGAAGEAVGVAERAVSLAPADPNSQHLAGLALLAAGRPHGAAERFLAAVELAPATQLRFHAGLVEALIQGKQYREARWRYAQAIERFSPSRVTAMDGRCLAPGDRYLLARLSRVVAPLYREAGLAALAAEVDETGKRLAAPDDRGICTFEDGSANRSPELALIGFWRALGAKGPSAGEPPWRQARPAIRGELPPMARPSGTRQVHVARIESLTGGEREVSVEYEIAVVEGDAQARRCASSVLRRAREGWFLASPPQLSPTPCSP